ncbi:UNVERIFIED_CONTAM: hypothetical protein Sindi_3089000 [Sesamum indicum]
MEQCRQGKSAKWIRNLGKRIGSEAGHGVPVPNPSAVGELLELLPRESGRRVPAGDGLGTAPSGPSPASNSRLRTVRTRESDCLIKTKHCDGPCGCSRNVISAQCSECQSEEIQPSAVNGGVTMTLLSETTAKERLGGISGKEDPVELDSSPTL